MTACEVRRWLAGVAFFCALMPWLFAPAVVLDTQWQMLGSMVLAIASLAAVGDLVLRRLRIDAPGVFLRVLAGQLAAWLLLYAQSPVVALLKPGGVPLRATFGALFGAALVAALIGRRRRARSPAPPAADRDVTVPLACAGMALAAVVAALYSWHLGDVGHDTKQHIYWATQIMSSGYVPLNAWHTGVIENYVRGFHALSAIWATAGQSPYTGAFVKMQPYLQVLIALVAFAEQAWAPAPDDAGMSPRTRRLGVGLTALAIACFTLLGGAALAPTADLSGTARYAFPSFIAVPGILLVLAYRRKSAAAALTGIATLAALPACALTFNPALLTQALCCYLPAYGLLWWLLRKGLNRLVAPRRVAVAAVMGLLLALLPLRDPFVLTTLSRVHPTAAALVARATGLKTYAQAVASGEIAADPRTTWITTAPPCPDLACYAQIAGGSLLKTLDYREDRSFLTFRKTLSDPRSLAGYKIFCLALLLLNGLRRPRRAPDAARTAALRLAAVVAAFGLFAGWSNDVSAAFFQEIGARAGFDLWLLGAYNHWASQHISVVAMGFFATVALKATVLGASDLAASPTEPRPPRRDAGPTAADALLVLACLAPFLFSQAPELLKPSWVRAFRAQQLQAFREIERQIGPDDVVLLPASVWTALGERWIADRDAAGTPFLFSDRKTLFHVYLGRGFLVTAGDFETKFCSQDAAVRRAFLQRQGVTRFFAFAPGSDTKKYFDDYRLCGLPLTAFGIRFPPLLSRADETLFAADPGRIE